MGSLAIAGTMSGLKYVSFGQYYMINNTNIECSNQEECSFHNITDCFTDFQSKKTEENFILNS